MKVMIDAHLPRRLARALQQLGHDVVHTSELPSGNRTNDADITAVSDQQRRVVVTKDSDFVDSHLLSSRPAKLLLVSTGNIGNDELLNLFLTNIAAIETAFASSNFVELNRDSLIAH